MNNAEDIPCYCQSLSLPFPLKVYYCYPAEADRELLDRDLSWLDVAAQNKISKLSKDQDKIATILGRKLLLTALKELNLETTLQQLTLESYGKPQINGCSFSIAHTDNLVCLAISKEGRIGLDCEKHCKININDFQFCFTNAEWQQIEQAATPISAFYNLWTRKEAMLKAIGCGLIDNLNTIDVRQDTTFFRQEHWRFCKLQISEKYYVHLCTKLEPV